MDRGDIAAAQRSSQIRSPDAPTALEKSRLGGAVPWGYRVGAAGELVPIPEQQAAIRRMRKLRDQGLALRAIAEKMKAAGVSISHAGVKNALAAAERTMSG